MGRPALDLSGQSFGKLLVLGEYESYGAARHVKWICKCSCGKWVTVRSDVLKRGHTKSCGCLYASVDYSKYNRTHGMSRKPIYKVWASMIARCANQKSSKYRYYGGRGINVCDEWHDFATFYANMGDRPSPKHSIDRINNDGNYEPSNCRWATQSEQLRNRRKYKRRAQ